MYNNQHGNLFIICFAASKEHTTLLLFEGVSYLSKIHISSRKLTSFLETIIFQYKETIDCSLEQA
jgi:hypothetical protein